VLLEPAVRVVSVSESELRWRDDMWSGLVDGISKLWRGGSRARK
jgi:hypothetical protein